MFLCHASEDRESVRKLSKRLREDGFDLWLDQERLLPGQDRDHEISVAVQDSHVVVVCLSASSVAKAGYVQKELRKVLDIADHQPEGRIFVVPVRLEVCAVPRRLANWQYADLFVDGGYERLRAALEARAEESAQDPAKPRPYRGRWIGAIIISIAIVGGAFYTLPGLRTTGAGSAPSPATAQAAAVPPGMVRVPGGRFLMGRNGASDPEASPAHEMDVAAFYLDETPVTNRDFRKFLQSTNGAAAPLAGEDLAPVTGVTWDEAYAYCRAEGKRLPTEAEWEFAARGTDGRLFPWGEAFDLKSVNSRESGIGRPEQVGVRTWNRSPFGVADMAGNVWQWCADEYKAYPGATSSFRVPAGAKAIRGGSFESDRYQTTAVTRNLELPSKRSPVIGFRCAKYFIETVAKL